MRTKYGDVYADEAHTRRKFDRSLDVFKRGHKRNLETIKSRHRRGRVVCTQRQHERMRRQRALRT
jgi:hypothetical protein